MAYVNGDFPTLAKPNYNLFISRQSMFGVYMKNHVKSYPAVNYKVGKRKILLLLWQGRQTVIIHGPVFVFRELMLANSKGSCSQNKARVLFME